MKEPEKPIADRGLIPASTNPKNDFPPFWFKEASHQSQLCDRVIRRYWLIIKRITYSHEEVMEVSELLSLAHYLASSNNVCKDILWQC